LFLFTLVAVYSQDVQVSARFGSDSIKLGQPVPYSVTVTYPSKWQVLLPDSTFSFAPFEFQKKVYFPTSTKSDKSTDSVVYMLSTFEVDSIQALKLPAFVVLPNDCTYYESNTDTIFFKHLVAQIPDSLRVEQLPLKTNTAYTAVQWLFNYPVFSIIIGIILVLLVIGWILFGKRIRKHFTLKRLQKKHEEFLTDFDLAIERLKIEFSSEQAEKSVLIWKRYMENLLSRPYTKSTSRELRLLEKNEMLTKALFTIDRSIYGNIPPESLDSFGNLKEFSKMQFNKKLEEVNHG
jgi:hypothetical protein